MGIRATRFEFEERKYTSVRKPPAIFAVVSGTSVSRFIAMLSKRNGRAFTSLKPSTLPSGGWKPCSTQIPSRGLFSDHLQSLETQQEKVAFLKNVREFVEACKCLYMERHRLPDLTGRGGLAFIGTSVVLLDHNNILMDVTQIQPGVVIVPVDDKGYPAFDASLHLLFHIEKELLVHRNGNYPVKCLHAGPDASHGEPPPELDGIFVSYDQFKADHFYGAVKYQERRELFKQLQQTWVHNQAHFE